MRARHWLQGRPRGKPREALRRRTWHAPRRDGPDDPWRSRRWLTSIMNITSRSRSSAESEVECLAGLAKTLLVRRRRGHLPGRATRPAPSTSSSRARSRSWTSRPTSRRPIVVHGPREFTGRRLAADRPPRRHLGLRQGGVPGLLRQPGRASPGDPGDPRPQRQAARGVPDAPDHAGAVRVRRRARLRAPRRPGPDGHPRVLRQEQGAAHLDRRRRAGRPGRHEVAGGRPGSAAVRGLQPGHAVAAPHGHPAGRVPRPEAADPHRAVRPGDRRGRARPASRRPSTAPPRGWPPSSSTGSARAVRPGPARGSRTTWDSPPG